MRQYVFALLSVLVVGFCAAQTAPVAGEAGSFDDETLKDGPAYLAYLEGMQAEFADVYDGRIAEKFCITPFGYADEVLPHCLCISTCDETCQLVYTVDRFGIKRIAKNLPADGRSNNWRNIAAMGMWTPANDATKAARPLFAHVVNNGTTPSAYHETGVADASARNLLFYRNSCSPVKYLSQHSDEDGYNYEYSIADPLLAESFAGMSDAPAAVLVDGRFFDTHTMLAFDCPKADDPARSLDDGRHDDYLKQIAARYGNRPVVSSQWLATADESTEYWLVEFERRPDNALAAIIAFKDRRLLTTYDDYARIYSGDPNPESLWDLDDKGVYTFPEILAVVENGVAGNVPELFVKQACSDHYQYFILRQNKPNMTLIYYLSQPYYF